MEVWAVEFFSFGEWSLDSIFSSKEKAEEYVKKSDKKKWEVVITKMKVQ